MKLVVEGDRLARVLAGMKDIAVGKVVPSLSHVLLQAQDNVLTVTATDLSMTLTEIVPAEIAECGQIAVPAATLGSFLKKLPSGAQVTLEDKATISGSDLSVRTGRSRVNLHTLPAHEFPATKEDAFPTRLDMKIADLEKVLDRVVFATSTEETRYYLTGVYLHQVAEGTLGEGLCAAATDGHRLALLRLLTPAGTGTAAGAIVPRRAMEEIARLVKAQDPESLAEVSLSATLVRVRLGAKSFTSKLIDGKFPDYERALPRNNDKFAVVDRRALAAAVDRVSTVSGDRDRSVKFTFERGELTLTAGKSDHTATDALEADYDAEPVAIGFNGNYVQDILRAVPGDRVRFELADPGSPAMLAAVGNDDCRFVLMPMRV
ncbi:MULTISPECIES: DNA polymerase III subunit beta [unclassified Xanthobacter]|uniref:DNA polymerase III subunit beta n=1 Tax=unclassified Xanthobacter TaxID=2623496 RepID=UPI001F1D9BDE|nr:MULTISPECIES: DNA polymerase III subunit beta [unclassified Xanthobacter]